MPRALVVGAGIGGLACAVALSRIGWDVRVFERADEPRELGFGLALAPNALAALHELGVAHAVLPLSVTPRRAEIRHVDGRLIRSFNDALAAVPAGVELPRVVLRPALHRTLLSAVGGHRLEVGHDVIGCTSDGTGATLQFADRPPVRGDLVVGADGFHSVVRARLHPDEPAARPSGYLALRGASPAVDRPDGLQALWYFGPGIEAGVAQAASDRIYWFLSLLARDVDASRRDPGAILRAWAPRFDAPLRAITVATPAEDLRLDELFERRPLRTWGHGRITLLGDAAHPMLPHTGQGAAQALEDAVGLGRALNGATDHVDALRRYEAVRSARTARIVRAGPRIARVTTTRRALMAAARTAALRLVPHWVIVAAMSRQGADPNRALGTGPLPPAAPQTLEEQARSEKPGTPALNRDARRRGE